MRKPLLDSLGRNRGGTSGSTSIPAPIGGWNTRDALAQMPSVDAVVLDNWFPKAGECVLRGGSTNFATGMTGTVKTLARYTPPTGTELLLAATDAGIYNITAGGAAGSVVTALTNGEIYPVLLTNSAGTTFFWSANGTDKVKLYDGSTWTTLDSGSTPAITGVTTSLLTAPWLFKHRIFAIEKGTLNFYYLPLDSIAGAASKFPLGSLFKRGGQLYAGTSWSLDAGDGPDDLCVFITSEGELALYKGTDPSSATSWSIVGVFYVGKPLSRRCFFRLGADVGVILDSGVFMLSRLLKGGNVNFANALSSKIHTSFTEALTARGFSASWAGILFPTQDALIINTPPLSGVAPQQFVINTVTGSWCSFSGWEAYCFEVKGTNLYFGTIGGIVLKAWDGDLTGDNGADITTTAYQAYYDFGKQTNLKQVTMFRPLLANEGGVETRWAISADYQDVFRYSVLPRDAPDSGPIWDVAIWDVTGWGNIMFRKKLWRAAAHQPGYKLSLRLQTASNASKMTWSGTDYIVASGGEL